MKAVKEIKEGILVDIEISPKSDKFEFSEYNRWRKRIGIRIKSIPHKGKANREIIEEFSKITNSNVKIVSGTKSRQKTLKIYKITKRDFLNLLKNFNRIKRN
jgi:uncharacterized protein